MRVLLSILLIASATMANAQSMNTLNLMPVPKSLAVENGRFQLTAGFAITVKSDKKDSILLKAVNRMFQTLNRRSGLYFRQEIISPEDHQDSAGMIVRVKQKAAMTIGVDESYQVRVTNKQLSLDANTTIGALRGLETILQLLSLDEAGFYFPLVTIQDAPRFVWRGLMIDVARHFIPMEVIKRNVEAMAAVRMNVLHLHLSDDQGFRVESKLYPRLQSMGSDGAFYTQAEIRELIQFAGERGILIVPEFDMPGHASSWFAGYPELATKPGAYKPGMPYKIDRSKPVSVMSVMQLIQTTPFPSFNPVKESVYNFLDRFIGEMSALFPAPYFHIGADENNGVAWKQDSAIVAFMRKNKMADTHELQAYFADRVQKLVMKYGKKTIGWEEVFSKNLSRDVVVQVWSPMSPPSLAQQIAAHGNPMILSKGFYLDLFMPASIHYKTEFPSDGFLGGEAAQWTEIADAENIETRIWPRAAAIAERFWSPKSVVDVTDMYRRLFIISGQLNESGLMHEANYNRMVSRFAAGYNDHAARTLMDVLPPVKGYKRLFGLMAQPEAVSYPTAPLVRAADIARIDPQVKWAFRNNVSEYVHSKSAGSERAIRDQLVIWSANDKLLEPLFKSSALAREITEHSKNLSALSKACLEALDMMQAGKKPDAQWLTGKKQLLESAKGTYGEVELSVLPELSSLITGQWSELPESYPVF
ncbi:MAG TPA: beta-hexosaminidase [Chitinophagaceae bacterium]|nr:beta-hexosaminidase [Chitinophagaceae bacterium]